MAILLGSQLLERTRKLSDDYVAPYFTSDEELYMWITEAERELALVGKLLREVLTYSLDASRNSRWISIDKRAEVIEFRSAVLVDSGSNRYTLKLFGAMDQKSPMGDFDDYGLIRRTETLSPGMPEQLIFGKDTDKFEVAPPSNADYTIEASAIIYPKNPIERATDEPTIAQRYHQYIPAGAALLAMEGTEDEQLQARVNRLQALWQKGLDRAAKESGSISRDAAPVRFANDLWG